MLSMFFKLSSGSKLRDIVDVIASVDESGLTVGFIQHDGRFITESDAFDEKLDLENDVLHTLYMNIESIVSIIKGELYKHSDIDKLIETDNKIVLALGPVYCKNKEYDTYEEFVDEINEHLDRIDEMIVPFVNNIKDILNQAEPMLSKSLIDLLNVLQNKLENQLTVNAVLSDPYGNDYDIIAGKYVVPEDTSKYIYGLIIKDKNDNELLNNTYENLVDAADDVSKVLN